MRRGWGLYHNGETEHRGGVTKLRCNAHRDQESSGPTNVCIFSSMTTPQDAHERFTSALHAWGGAITAHGKVGMRVEIQNAGCCVG